MANKVKKVEPATEAEIRLLRSRGFGTYLWEFPEETFNGEWWKLTVPNNQVKSLGNSFRSQCKVVYKRRASVHNKDGSVFVRMKDEPFIEPATEEKKR